MASLSRLLLGLSLGVGLMLAPDASFGADGPKHKGGAGKSKTATKATKSKGAKAKRKPARRAENSTSAGRARATGKKKPLASAPELSPRQLPLAILINDIECPADMVAVAGRVCVDRFETSLVDSGSGTPWPPFYTPNLERARAVFDFYSKTDAPPTLLENAPAIPELPRTAIRARARSIAGVLPQGYLSADQAETACAIAGKRLCSEAEWVTACRGEAQRDFPYGDKYEQGTCNVYRESHPSALLHDNAARYHDDPRNHLVEVAGRPLLQPTNEKSRCASRWGDDAVMDMVGNLDEWVSDAGGVFVGGFYSRGTRSGCLSRVSAHVRSYSDYSTGARCCKDPQLDSGLR
jgi:formylglycine-generating enzyme